MDNTKKKIEYLVVDTTAFLQNTPLHHYADNIYTCQEVVDEVTNKRQRHRLLVLPYDLKVKTVFTENLDAVMEFSKKTGDYASLSLTDLKVMALTYQLEKEKVGTDHIRTAPLFSKSVNFEMSKKKPTDIRCNLPGWYHPKSDEESEADDDEDSEKETSSDESEEESENECHEKLETNESDANPIEVKSLSEHFESLNCNEKNDLKADEEENGGEQTDDLQALKQKFENVDSNINGDPAISADEILVKVEDGFEEIGEEGWITPSNCRRAQQLMYEAAGQTEDKEVKVACMTTDFAMQNVLKQMNLNVAALNGRVIKQVRTFILRCYACFKTTSVMTKVFCPKCGNQTLKKVAVSVDEEGKMVIHINARKKISGKGKRFSLPAIKGGKHPNNPIIVEDQRIPHNRPTKAALKKNNPLDDDYIAGYSPFVMRDVTSRATQLGIRSANQFKVPKRNGRKR
ncbi:RNA-binding protein NOB1 [Coccinella septempunctata]|uniref:RNA-binding protein NOB1 n=1 Tax=Coccinella septempunctata TaxID=41139 RepID=UPI001D08C829|nr:RNA-binding protein NOB1 [Coccinella septempunctata]